MRMYRLTVDGMIARRSAVSAFLAWLAFSSLATALTNEPAERIWVPNFVINAVVCNGTDVYAGGNFIRWGESSGYGVPFDATNGLPIEPFPNVAGHVFTVVSDGSGGWFIGGDFIRVGGLQRKRLAHILADGSVDSAWNPEAGDTVHALNIQGGILYVGGDFGAAGGVARERLAALNTTTGAAYSWNPGANGIVRSIAASAGMVYVGGDFTQVGASNRNYIAAIDATTGTVAPWNGNADGEVYALALGTGVLYAGGYFTTIGGQSRNCVAALDSVTGSATAWDADITYGQSVLCMALASDGDTLYIGGNFGEIAGEWHQNATALDTSTGAVIPWVSYIGNTVLAMALSPDEGTLFVGGNFDDAFDAQSSQNFDRYCLAAIDLQADSITAWDPSANGTAEALATQGDQVYAGGEFDAIGSVQRRALALVDTTSGHVAPWNPDVSTGPNSAGNIACLSLSGETLYVGGGFCQIGSDCRTNLAAIDTKTGLASAWHPDPDYKVRAMTFSPDRQTLYVGGYFSTMGGSPRNHLAAIDVASGAVTAWNPQMAGGSSDTVVLDLACRADGQLLYVAGTFTNVGGVARNHLAAIDTTTGTATGWNPDPNHVVYALAFSPDSNTLYVGGVFTNIAGTGRQHAAAFDTATGALKSWDPSVNNGYVYDLAVDGSGTVYIAGEFYGVGEEARLNLAAVDGTNGIPTDWVPAADHNAYVLMPSGDAVFAGGDWRRMNWDARPCFAQFGEQNLGADSDGDGLTDTWERVCFGDLSHDGTSDWDSDGLNDRAEQRAGTAPTNSESVLRFESIVPTFTTNAMVLSWQSVSGRQYCVRSGTNLMEVLSTVVTSHVAATPPMNTYTANTDSATLRFYRIDIED